MQAEIARLNKTIQALMDRAERSASSQESDYSRFQVTVMLEDRIRTRTAELEAALAENEKINRALRESEAKFRGVVGQSLVGITITENGKFTYSNAKFDEIFGYTADEMRQLGPVDLAADEDRAMVEENVRRRVSGEIDQIDFGYRGLRKDGAVIDIEVHGSVMELGGKRALISMLLDVTERVRAARDLQALQDKLREQSIHDGLTGLYNRFYLDDFLSRELIAAKRADYPVSAIMADLDHFKAVNDHYGHLAGDEVLRVLGDLLKQHARGSDMCSRYGGEEFLLVLPGMSQDAAARRAEQLRSALAAVHIPFDGSNLEVTASFGVATFPVDGATADSLISAADGALYASKAAGRNRVSIAKRPQGTGVPPPRVPAAA
ncbi:MAG: GGDEF domain-containing protein [Devosia nanyangense]|uniref:diguanylate cyclase n=1 Tax=Devosia nanyangense TaxID=1228055 RepID=A0A933L1P4_9HYPH|nr:GGDEF domain-containing protein [Devosia nanyangense]